jgi:hypothetical protein
MPWSKKWETQRNSNTFSSVQAQLAKMGVRTRAPVSALYKPKALNPNGQHSGIGYLGEENTHGSENGWAGGEQTGVLQKLWRRPANSDLINLVRVTTS